MSTNRYLRTRETVGFAVKLTDKTDASELEQMLEAHSNRFIHDRGTVHIYPSFGNIKEGETFQEYELRKERVLETLGRGLPDLNTLTLDCIHNMNLADLTRLLNAHGTHRRRDIKKLKIKVSEGKESSKEERESFHNVIQKYYSVLHSLSYWLGDCTCPSALCILDAFAWYSELQVIHIYAGASRAESKIPLQSPVDAVVTSHPRFRQP